MTKRSKKKRRSHPGTTEPNGSESRGATTGEYRGPVVENMQDLHMLAELRACPDWTIPDEAFRRLGYDLLKMAKNTQLKEGTRLAAMRELRALARDNVAKSRTTVNAFFSPGVIGAMAPRLPERDVGDEDESGVVDATSYAYVEKVSPEELIETAKALIGTALDPDQMTAVAKSNGNGSNGNGSKNGHG